MTGRIDLRILVRRARLAAFAGSLMAAPCLAKDSDNVDFFVTAKPTTTTPAVVPVNVTATAAFSVGLGVPNAKNGEDAAKNVRSQSYTVDVGQGGVIDSVTFPGTTVVVAPGQGTLTFLVNGGNAAAVVDVSIGVHYTSASAADDDKIIGLSGTVTFDDDTPTTPDTLSTKVPAATVTCTAVAIVSLSCDGTQNGVEQDATVNGVEYVNNWAALKVTGKGVVTATVVLSPNTDHAASIITWKGGHAVKGQPRQVTVDRTVAAVTPVTVSCGVQNVSLNVWVIWATLSVMLAAADTVPHLPGDIGAAMSGATGTTELGPGSKSIHFKGFGGTHVWGNYVVVGKIVPPGVGGVVYLDWAIERFRWSLQTTDGVDNPYNDMAMTDESDIQGEQPQCDYYPDSNGQIFDADWPGFLGYTVTNEMNVNFQTYVTWQSAYASDGAPEADALYYSAAWSRAAKVCRNELAAGFMKGTLTAPPNPPALAGRPPDPAACP